MNGEHAFDGVAHFFIGGDDALFAGLCRGVRS